jgi:hypothetical protein
VDDDSGFLVALTIHNVKILVAEEFAPECGDTVLTDLLGTETGAAEWGL